MTSVLGAPPGRDARRAAPRRLLLGGPLGGATGLAVAGAVAAGAALAPRVAGPTMVVVVVAVVVVGAALADPAAALVLLVLTCFLRTPLQALDVGLPLPTMLLATALLGVGLAVARGRLTLAAPGAVEVAMGLYLAWNLVSWASPHDTAAVGPGSVAALVVTGIAFPFALFTVGRAAGSSARVVRALLWAVLAVTAYSTWLAVLAFHGPRSLVWPAYVVDAPGWRNRAVGVFDQPVTNGVLLLLGVAVGLYLAVTARSRPARITAGLVALTAVYGVYLTHTRAIWAAAVVVLVLALGVRETRRGAAGALGVLAVLVAANWATLAGSDRATGGVGSSSEVDDRLNMIATAWWAIGEHPWVGWGLARFQQINLYYHQQWSPEIDYRRGLGIASHENELGIAAELGIVGLALWVAVVVLLGRRILRLLRETRDLGRTGPGDVGARDLALLAATALVVLLVVGTTVDLRFLDFALALVFLLVGAAVGRREATR